MSLISRLTRQAIIRQPLFKSRLVSNNLTIQCSKNTCKRFYSTEKKQAPQTFTWKSAVVLGVTAVGLVVYFKNEKERLKAVKAKKERDTIRALGRPAIGQPFELLNANTGKLISSQELMEGQFTFIYFGFTHCPDICPEELDKMADVVELVKKDYGNILTPVFITCDPLRDTEQVVKEYVQDFHPDLIGLTGSMDDLKKVARSYRVYSYTPPNVSADDDYLVDHSIFIYLMDPQGRFIDCYARDTTVQEVYDSFKNYMKDYLQDSGKLKNYNEAMK